MARSASAQEVDAAGLAGADGVLRRLEWQRRAENLVARISEWEGLHCAGALIDGKPMAGMWYDRAIEPEYETKRQVSSTKR
ncbi:MAG: hypothetical protein GY722_20770 [bacterium]|nr:hypothetical protein [bacterium]